MRRASAQACAGTVQQQVGAVLGTRALVRPPAQCHRGVARSCARQRLSTHFDPTVEGAKAQELAHFHPTRLRIFTRRGDSIAAGQTPDSGRPPVVHYTCRKAPVVAALRAVHKDLLLSPRRWDAAAAAFGCPRPPGATPGGQARITAGQSAACASPRALCLSSGRQVGGPPSTRSLRSERGGAGMRVSLPLLGRCTSSALCPNGYACLMSTTNQQEQWSLDSS